MKSSLCLLGLLVLVSCSDRPSPPSTPRPKIVSRDSVVRKNEAFNPYVSTDVSPMDMSYFPTDYPKQSVRRVMPTARVIYSRPHKDGRKIFGNLLKYGDPWRLGANESTEIEFFQPVTIQDKKVDKGRYVLYCIPQENKWTVVFNSNLYSWGLEQDKQKDLFRFDIPVKVKKQSIEYFSMAFQQTENGADLVMAWDDVEARLPLQFSLQ